MQPALQLQDWSGSRRVPKLGRSHFLYGFSLLPSLPSQNRQKEIPTAKALQVTKATGVHLKWRQPDFTRDFVATRKPVWSLKRASSRRSLGCVETLPTFIRSLISLSGHNLLLFLQQISFGFVQPDAPRAPQGQEEHGDPQPCRLSVLWPCPTTACKTTGWSSYRSRPH